MRSECDRYSLSSFSTSNSCAQINKIAPAIIIYNNNISPIFTGSCRYFIIGTLHKKDSGLRPYYLTHEFTIHDAPFNDEIVIAIGGASSGRAHARTGDRYQDMKEMGLKS